jgi:hypothetical protein
MFGEKDRPKYEHSFRKRAISQIIEILTLDAVYP